MDFVTFFSLPSVSKVTDSVRGNELAYVISGTPLSPSDTKKVYIPDIPCWSGTLQLYTLLIFQFLTEKYLNLAYSRRTTSLAKTSEYD